MEYIQDLLKSSKMLKNLKRLRTKKPKLKSLSMETLNKKKRRRPESKMKLMMKKKRQ